MIIIQKIFDVIILNPFSVITWKYLNDEKPGTGNSA